MVAIEIITWLLIYQSLILIFTFLFLLDNAKTLLLCYAQLCLTLSNAMDYSQLGSSVHGIFQARILKWVAIPSPGDPPDPGMEPTGGFFTTVPLGNS